MNICKILVGLACVVNFNFSHIAAAQYLMGKMTPLVIDLTELATKAGEVTALITTQELIASLGYYKTLEKICPNFIKYGKNGKVIQDTHQTWKFLFSPHSKIDTLATVAGITRGLSLATLVSLAIAIKRLPEANPAEILKSLLLSTFTTHFIQAGVGLAVYYAQPSPELCEYDDEVVLQSLEEKRLWNAVNKSNTLGMLVDKVVTPYIIFKTLGNK